MKSIVDDFISLYKKHHIAFSLFISTMLFYISCFWWPLMILPIAFLTVTFVYSSVSEIFSYLLYFMFFSRSSIFYGGLAVCAFVVILVKYFKDLKTGKVKTYKAPLIATTIICVVFSLIIYRFYYEGFFQGLLIIGLFYLTYLMFCYRKQFNLDECFKIMFWGVIASTIVSFALYFISDAKILTYSDGGFYFETVHNLVFIREYEYLRPMLLTYHPNHLASYCMYIATYSIYAIMNNKFKGKKKELFKYFGMFFIVVCIGFLTISKAFILIVGIIVLYAIIYYLVKMKKKALKYILPVLGILLVLSLFFSGFLMDTFRRFFLYTDKTILGMLTSGRTEIWFKFMGEIFSSPWKVLFGLGICATDVVAIGPHNLYIALLYRFGLVGCSCIAVLGYTYIIASNEKIKFSFKKFLPLFIFLVHSIQECNIDERFLFLIFSIMLLFTQKSVNTNLSKEKDEKAEEKITTPASDAEMLKKDYDIDAEKFVQEAKINKTN